MEGNLANEKMKKVALVAGGVVAIAAAGTLIFYMIKKHRKADPNKPIVPENHHITWNVGPSDLTVIAKRADGKGPGGKPSVGCYSPTQHACYTSRDAPDIMKTLNDSSPVLWCGAQHAAIYGDDGYSKPGHWCNSA